MKQIKELCTFIKFTFTKDGFFTSYKFALNVQNIFQNTKHPVSSFAMNIQGAANSPSSHKGRGHLYV